MLATYNIKSNHLPVIVTDVECLTSEPTFIKVPFSKEKFMLDFIKYAQPSELGQLSENIIGALYQFQDPPTNEYDFKSLTGRIEIKSSRAYSHRGERSMCTIKELLTNDSYDCNIQHIKKKLFDYLYYVVFCQDGLQILRIPKRRINKTIGYSDSQQRNHLGNGQFHLNFKTYPKHVDYILENIPYEEIYDVLDKEAGFVHRIHA